MLNQHNDSDSRIEIVLTFDDGPHAAKLGANRTKKVMDVLRLNNTSPNMKAIFFIQTHSRGELDDKYFRGNTDIGKELIRRMHASGHIIGVHTGHDVEKADHISHTDRTARELDDDIDRASNFIEDVLAKPLEGSPYLPKLIRPVEGKVNPNVVRTYYKKYYKLTMWDVDSEDTRPGATPEKVKRALVTNTWKALQAGKRKLLVLFHDTNRYIPLEAIRANLETYIEIIKATVEGDSNLLHNRFGLDVKTLIGTVGVPIEPTGLSPVFVDNRERVVEIVRWKYWDEQDGYVRDLPKDRE